MQRLQNKLLFKLWNVQHDNSEQLSGPRLTVLWKVVSPSMMLMVAEVLGLLQEALLSNKYTYGLL